MERTPIVIIIIVIIFLITIILSYNYGRCVVEREMLRGFYETNREFNEESGISSFTFYIGDCINGTYNVYLLMIGDDDEKILINSPTEMILTSAWDYGCDHYEYKVKFTDLNSEFIPNNVVLKHYVRSGKIILSDKDTIYGCLFKNPVLTEMDLIKSEKKSLTQLSNYSSIPRTIENINEIEDI